MEYLAFSNIQLVDLCALLLYITFLTIIYNSYSDIRTCDIMSPYSSHIDV